MQEEEGDVRHCVVTTALGDKGKGRDGKGRGKGTQTAVTDDFHSSGDAVPPVNSRGPPFCPHKGTAARLTALSDTEA